MLQKLLLKEWFKKHHIKIEHQKVTNLLDATFDGVPRFITKK